MPTRKTPPDEALSHWWPRSVAIVMMLGFAVLILLSVRAYWTAPPIPTNAVAADGAVVVTGVNVTAGQEVFLKYGLMDNGTIWGHGGLLGPDFTAQTRHGLALTQAERLAQARFQRPNAQLTEPERASIDAAMAFEFKRNGYDPATGTLRLPADGQAAFEAQVTHCSAYFTDPAGNGGSCRPIATGCAIRRGQPSGRWFAQQTLQIEALPQSPVRGPLTTGRDFDQGPWW